MLERSVRLDGRKFDEIRPICDRDRRPAPRPRLGRVHARRDAGARHRHARHRRRPAEDRDASTARRGSASCCTTTSRRSRSAKSKLHARPRPPRDRPRRARRARARADDADRRQLPLHHPHRLRHPRVERQLVDGLGLRRLAGDDGRRRADQGAGRGRGDGPDHGREDRQVRGPDATSPAPRTTTATWTSRSPAPPTASPRCRWTSRSPASPPEIMREALDAGPRRPAAHPRQDGTRRCRRTAHEHVGVRAAHRHHQDPGRQDPRRHRARRQDDPQHHRADRREDRRRGRRPGQRGVGGRSRGARRPSASSRS